MNSPNSFLGREQTPDYMPTQDERTLAILSHILTIVASFVAPLIIYIIKKDESRFVNAHAKESLNFQITVFILCVGLAITIVGLLLIWAVCLAALVLEIIATIRASENKLYRYPVNFRFIK